MKKVRLGVVGCGGIVSGAHIVGIKTAGGGNSNFITRTYVELADGTVVYGIPAVDNYNAVRGM